MVNEFAKWYPLCFRPERQETPWGGSLLAAFREGEPAAPGGVNWELVDGAGRSSVVLNGPLAGRTLGELTETFKVDLVGRRYQPGKPFPVYVRLLDVGAPMPLTVHADESFARKHPALEINTKFWYCLAARGAGEIMVGIGARVTRQQLLPRMASTDRRHLLQTFAANAGDAYLVPAGRVHAISPETLVWEIGHHPCEPMELHPHEADGLAMAAVHFEDRQVARVCREAAATVATRRIPLVHHCPYFVMDEIRLVDYLSDRTDGSSFHLFTVVSGRVELETEAGVLALPTGATCLVPAALGNYKWRAAGDPAIVLRCRLQNLK